MIGRAELKGAAFDFKVGEWSGGIGLMMRDAGSGDLGFNGAGIWPSVEKAKQIADQTAKRLVGPECTIIWTDCSAGH